MTRLARACRGARGRTRRRAAARALPTHLLGGGVAVADSSPACASVCIRVQQSRQRRDIQKTCTRAHLRLWRTHKHQTHISSTPISALPSIQYVYQDAKTCAKYYAVGILTSLAAVSWSSHTYVPSVVCTTLIWTFSTCKHSRYCRHAPIPDIHGEAYKQGRGAKLCAWARGGWATAYIPRLRELSCLHANK